MSIEKMNELISKWERQKAEYDRKMDEKISAMKAQRDHDLLAQMQKTFARKHISPEDLMKFKNATREQIQHALASMGDNSGIKEDITKNENVTT